MHDPVTVAVPSAIVICGKGSIATSALSYTVHYAAAHALSSRVLASPNADDKGFDTWQQSLTRAASQLGVGRVGLKEIESIPDLLLVSLEYDRIVPVMRFASKRLFNIHFSALPRYRGVYTSIWPVLNGETSVGVTLHYMDPGVDTGDIVANRTFDIPPYATSRDVYQRYMQEGLELFRDWLPRLLTSLPRGTPQIESDATSYNRKSLDVRQVEIDLTVGSAAICAFVRAFAFPEYQLPILRGRAVRACSIIPGPTSLSPGTAIHETAYSTSFAAGDGTMVELIWG
jgi:methionyl-tRNA formyltransferase